MKWRLSAQLCAPSALVVLPSSRTLQEGQGRGTYRHTQHQVDFSSGDWNRRKSLFESGPFIFHRLTRLI